MASHSDSVSDVLIHPDALYCLKRKQLENLCIRLDLKATGKKDELIARLEGYASAKIALEGSSSVGKIVSAAPPRSRTESITSLTPSEFSEQKEEEFDADSDMNEIPDAGPSIRLITQHQEEAVNEDEGDVTVMAEIAASDCIEQPQATLPPSSSSKSLYPWKRIASSSSISKRLRSASSISTSSSRAKDEPMTTEEFGGKAAGQAGGFSRVNSIGSLKRWLSKTSSSSSLSNQAQAIDTLQFKEAPQLPALLTSPMSKRKRDSDVIDEAPLSPEIEVPVRRAIKPRPSRAIRTGLSSPVRETPIAINFSSPTSITQVDFSKAATKVLEEMNARLVQNGKPSMVQLPTAGNRSVSTSMKLPASPLKTINSRTKGRFSGEHAKNFGQMDSIVNHYAAKRIELASREWNGAASTTNNNPSASKRVKINDDDTNTTKEKSSEERAVTQRKLELAKQRRKSGAKRVSMGRKSAVVAPRVGFKSKITGAVRDFVGAASKIASEKGRYGPVVKASAEKTIPGKGQTVPVVVAEQSAPRQTKPPQLPSKSLPTPRVASGSSSSSSTSTSSNLRQIKSKPTFDLHASLARRPMGYKPYSAKETVQLLQTAAAVPKSPSKNVDATTTTTSYSPIRTGWTMVQPPTKRIVSSSSTIAFPCVSPGKESQSSSATKVLPPVPTVDTVGVEVKVVPRRNTMQNVTNTKKTRSSISTARQGTMQADRLKRISKLNESKHQASMAARRKQGVVVQKAVDKYEKVTAAKAATTTNGKGRGTPRKSSAKLEMQGKGRGLTSVKRVVS